MVVGLELVGLVDMLAEILENITVDELPGQDGSGVGPDFPEEGSIDELDVVGDVGVEGRLVGGHQLVVHLATLPDWLGWVEVLQVILQSQSYLFHQIILSVQFLVYYYVPQNLTHCLKDFHRKHTFPLFLYMTVQYHAQTLHYSAYLVYATYLYYILTVYVLLLHHFL